MNDTNPTASNQDRLHEQAWTHLDKTQWGPGPWADEPDKVSWTDAATGRPCLAVRPHSSWCGYVAVDPGHPLHGVDYSQCTKPDCTDEWCYDHSPAGQVQVHGGLTFAARCRPGQDEGRGVCHVPQPGQPDDVWWFGFDCAHSGDLTPNPIGCRFDGDEYRDLAYVQSECASLAAQLSRGAEVHP